MHLNAVQQFASVPLTRAFCENPRVFQNVHHRALHLQQWIFKMLDQDACPCFAPATAILRLAIPAS